MNTYKAHFDSVSDGEVSVINHNLDTLHSVMIIYIGGEIVFPPPPFEHIDSNTIHVYWINPAADINIMVTDE